MNQIEVQEQTPGMRPNWMPDEEGLDSLGAIARFIASAHDELQLAVAKVRRAEAALDRWLRQSEQVLGSEPVTRPERKRDVALHVIPAALERHRQPKEAAGT